MCYMFDEDADESGGVCHWEQVYQVITLAYMFLRFWIQWKIVKFVLVQNITFSTSGKDEN
jgi:hypothetical protein